MNIFELSASMLVAKIRNQELTSRQVVEAFLKRIDVVNPQINAIHQVDPERILREADAADQAVRDGKPLGKLHGLPISIKDTCLVAGFTVGRGYPGLMKRADRDATIIQRLKAAGAIILGITNVPEFLAAYEADNRTYGRTNNPHDLTRTSGGSSGGEAALIAAGGSPAGIGSDAGGSIGQPAHYCGICGHKPTHGRVPVTGDVACDGAAGLINMLLVYGPMARHVEDLALMMEVISGSDGFDPHTPPLPFTRSAALDCTKLKIAFYFENPDAPPSEDIKQAVMTAVQALEAQGATIHHDFPDILTASYQLHWETFMLGGDQGVGLKAFFEQCSDTELTPLLKRFVAQAEAFKISPTELKQRYSQAEIFRYALMKWMTDGGYDVLISPVAASPARHHGTTFDHFGDFNYVRTHNLSMWPTTTVPISYSKEGLPINVLIAAKPWHDHLTLAVAETLQKIVGVFPVANVEC